MSQPKLVLGFVGKFCAGKGTAISYLVDKHNFYASSCSDRIREEITSKGEEITRENLQETAGEMREKYGPKVLAEKTWEDLMKSNSEKVAIDSIRGIEEVKFFKTLPNFYLIAVDADQKIRYERMKSRGNKGEPVTSLEEFVASEERDINRDGRNIEACLTAADFRIENNSTAKELYQKLEHLLESLPK